MLPFTDDVTAIVKDWFFLKVDCMVIIFGHSELGCLLGIQVETSRTIRRRQTFGVHGHVMVGCVQEKGERAKARILGSAHVIGKKGEEVRTKLITAKMQRNTE